MATLREAEDARRAHSDELERCGAHAIGGKPGAEFGHDGYVVVAYVEPDAEVNLPKTLQGGSSSVPVVVTRSEKFIPESLKPDSL